MNHIVPAVIPRSLDHLRESLFKIRPFIREVQIDIVDGKFVPFTSWPYVKKASIEDLSVFTPVFSIEMDLMIERPEDVIPLYARVGVKKIVVHAESTKEFKRIVEQKKHLGFTLGYSINNDTPLTLITDHIRDIDYVQLMGIAHIGSQGQPFDERVLDRVRALKKTYPKLLISIDGSVNKETLPRLVEAGADRCVSGSAIMGAEDPKAMLQSLASFW